MKDNFFGTSIRKLNIWGKKYVLQITDKLDEGKKQVMDTLGESNSPFIVRHLFRKRFVIYQKSSANQEGQFEKLRSILNRSGMDFFQLVGILTDFIEGPTLESLKGDIQHSDLFRYILHVANGLEWLHSKDIIHLDIKPKNIVLDKSHNNVRFYLLKYFLILKFRPLLLTYFMQ